MRWNAINSYDKCKGSFPALKGYFLWLLGERAIEMINCRVTHTHSKREYRGLHCKDRLERIKNPENKLLVAEPRVLEAPLAEGKGPSMRTQAATSANRVDLI